MEFGSHHLATANDAVNIREQVVVWAYVFYFLGFAEF